MMTALAWFVRKYNFINIMLIYLISMTAFSSAIANQYLAIPMAALCILNLGIWDKVYMTATGLYLLLEGNGLSLLSKIHAYFPGSLADKLFSLYVRGGYIIAAWILLFALIYFIKARRLIHE